MKFMVEKSGFITDKDFLRITKYKQLKRFLTMVACIESNTSLHESSQVKTEVLQRIKSWNKSIDWSFPPTWKVAIALCKNCGLPQDIFRDTVIPFLSRDWFYTAEEQRGQLTEEQRLHRWLAS